MSGPCDTGPIRGDKWASNRLWRDFDRADSTSGKKPIDGRWNPKGYDWSHHPKGSGSSGGGGGGSSSTSGCLLITVGAALLLTALAIALLTGPSACCTAGW